MADPLHADPAPAAEPRLPLVGYVLINAVVWIVCATIWLATKNAWFSGVGKLVDRPGAAVPLLFVCIAFLAASIYDYFFDGFSSEPAPDDDDDEQDKGEG